MTLNEILMTLKTARYSAKLSRDSQSMVVNYGDEGYIRVELVDAQVELRNHLNCGRARASGAMRDVRTDLGLAATA
jgi:hypothetical protein